MPVGLQRVRTATNGDVAYEFDDARQATAFNLSIRGCGRIYGETRGKERVVYLGQEISLYVM